MMLLYLGLERIHSIQTSVYPSSYICEC